MQSARCKADHQLSDDRVSVKLRVTTSVPPGLLNLLLGQKKRFVSQPFAQKAKCYAIFFLVWKNSKALCGISFFIAFLAHFFFVASRPNFSDN